MVDSQACPLRRKTLSRVDRHVELHLDLRQAEDREVVLSQLLKSFEETAKFYRKAVIEVRATIKGLERKLKENANG